MFLTVKGKRLPPYWCKQMVRTEVSEVETLEWSVCSEVKESSSRKKRSPFMILYGCDEGAVCSNCLEKCGIINARQLCSCSKLRWEELNRLQLQERETRARELQSMEEWESLVQRGTSHRILPQHPNQVQLFNKLASVSCSINLLPWSLAQKQRQEFEKLQTMNIRKLLMMSTGIPRFDDKSSLSKKDWYNGKCRTNLEKMLLHLMSLSHPASCIAATLDENNRLLYVSANFNVNSQDERKLLQTLQSANYAALGWNHICYVKMDPHPFGSKTHVHCEIMLFLFLKLVELWPASRLREQFFAISKPLCRDCAAFFFDFIEDKDRPQFRAFCWDSFRTTYFQCHLFL